MVAVLRNPGAANQFHDKVGTPRVRRPPIKHFGDIRMVHQRQRLALGFEAGDDLFGVHAHLDDLERDAAAHRLLLLGHINHAAAALADLLEQFVIANPVSGLFLLGQCQHNRRIAHGRGRRFQEPGGFFVRFHQFGDARSQVGVVNGQRNLESSLEVAVRRLAAPARVGNPSRHAMNRDGCQWVARAGGQVDRLLRTALVLSNQVLSSETGDLFIEGENNFFHTQEFSNLDKIREILGALSEKHRLVAFLDQALKAPGVKIFVGSEARDLQLNDCSLVVASYGDGQKPLGTLGVIGPTRMEYSKVIPIVQFTAQLLGEELK